MTKTALVNRPWPYLNLPQDLLIEWTRFGLLSDTHASQLINELKILSAQKTASKRRAAVVLDLDSTLLCVNPRSRAVFASFLNSLEEVPALWWRIYHHWSFRHHTYSIRETIENIMRELGEFAPLEQSYFLWKKFEPHWMEFFFSSRFMHYDSQYAGAGAWVEEIKKLDLDIVYLSGRDCNSSMAGTLHSLQKFKFPLDENTRIILKPGNRESMSDLDFKVKACEMLNHQYRILLSIDNEPENLLAMARIFSEAQIVWKYSVMSRRIPNSEELKRRLANRKLLCLKNFQSFK